MAKTRTNGQLEGQHSNHHTARTIGLQPILVADTDSSEGGRHVAETRIQFQWDRFYRAGRHSVESFVVPVSYTHLTLPTSSYV